MPPSDSEDIDNDPSLTVNEVAAELRLNPATIRLWISKGILPATRSGRRKLLIRRSDLDRMLELTRHERPASRYAPQPDPVLPQLEGGWPYRRRPPRSERQLTSADIHGRRVEPSEMEEILNGIQTADEVWHDAQAASENAPPDPGFPLRVRALADACEKQGHWLLRGAQTLGFQWTPVPGRESMVISPELRPGANRPGPQELWTEFDRAVERLGVAMEGRLMYNVAWAYRGLADVMWAIADALGDDTRGVR